MRRAMKDRLWTLMSFIVNDGADWAEVKQKFRWGYRP
jgi:hypothetical protein